MTQIDLINNEWTNIVFENRKREYGAYVLRVQTGMRNFAAIGAVLILVAVAMVALVAKNAYENYRREHATYDQVFEISNLTRDEVKPKVERVEPVRQEEVEKVIENVRTSMKFTAPVIRKDAEVNPDDEIKTQDEIMHSNVAIAFADVIGNDENGEVLHKKEIIAGETTKPAEDTKVHTIVEQMPSFPGGDAALMQWLSSHIKYPAVAAENDIQGRVVCTFIVGKDGAISDVEVIRSIDPSLDKEAVRVISQMPNWLPGRQNGQAVRVKYTLPVTFRLS